MKFYDFSEYEYTATIWAEDEKQACKAYNEIVSDIVGEEKELVPKEIDVDKVLEIMLECNYEDDKEIKLYGIAFELCRIIKSKEPVIVLLDSSLN